MATAVTVVGTIGFFIFLFLMHGTQLGIPGIKKFDAGFRILDMRFRYGAAEVYETFEKLGVNGRAAYSRFFILDFCFIACFLIVQLAVTKSLLPEGVFRTVLGALVILRAALDVVENCILLFLLQSTEAHMGLAGFCSWVTALKFVALFLWMGGIAFVLGRGLLQRFSKVL